MMIKEYVGFFEKQKQEKGKQEQSIKRQALKDKNEKQAAKAKGSRKK